MQAIVTKYKSPTNTTGSRIIASAAAGRKSVPYNSALTLDANHIEAANALMAKLGWTREGIAITGTGSLPDGNYCHTLAFTNK